MTEITALDASLCKSSPSSQALDKSWLRFIRGAHASGSQRVGLEMEMFAYDAQSLIPLGLPGSRRTPAEVLKRVSEIEPRASLKVDEPTGVVTGLMMPNGSNFSLEPGGQIEFSSAPYSRMADVASEVARGLRLLELATNGEVRFLSHGTNPLTGPSHPLVVPKSRYLALAAFFGSEPQGRGVHMSRNTGTVQANLDVSGDEAWNEAVNLAWLLTPFTHRIFSNSSYFDGKRSAFRSERQEIWRRTDTSRSGIPFAVPFAADIPSQYAEWALDAYVLFAPSLPADRQPKHGELRFRDWLANGVDGIRPTLADWEIHLGTLFPELRLRGFLEVRSVDAQPFEHTLAPVAFWSALLQNQGARTRVLDLLLGVARGRLVSSAFESAAPAAEVSDAEALRQLLFVPEAARIFEDQSLQERLVSIALDTLQQLKELTGHAALQAFARERFGSAEGAGAAEKAPLPETGLEFVKRYSTITPSADFLRHFVHVRNGAEPA